MSAVPEEDRHDRFPVKKTTRIHYTSVHGIDTRVGHPIQHLASHPPERRPVGLNPSAEHLIVSPSSARSKQRRKQRMTMTSGIDEEPEHVNPVLRVANV